MAEREVDQEIQSLREDLAILRSDIADLSSSVRDMASHRAHGVKASIEDDVRETRERLRERIAEARAQGARSVEDFEESIGQHPLASVATAVGVGFVLAKLMNLGSRH